jgi:DNA topoisomerase-1
MVPAKKRPQVKKLKQLAKNASALYLATDEDREGEAIAWHLKEVLDPSVPVYRMVFDEITETAIRNAVNNPRDLDEGLINAQQARRILDRLYGYEVSPVLWHKIGRKLSAGRVQSVATRLIVDRERDRMRFRAADYWDIEATLRPQGSTNGDRVLTHLVEVSGKRIAIGKDFDPHTGQLIAANGTRLVDEALAGALTERLRTAAFTVEAVTEKPFTQRPNPPFITSSLQQEAARKLRFTVQHTMRLAQSLYENGFITYMRTDSTHLSTQAVNAARAQAADLYGQQYIPDAPRHYVAKAKGAQEAHEAIRPAGASFRTPREVEGELHGDEFRLYDLIWKRTLACQMKDALGSRTTVRFAAPAGEHGNVVFSASGKTINFDGFLRAYVQGSDETNGDVEDEERVLPPLRQGDKFDPQLIEPKKHTTVPPARFTEAALIKELEERGIGRPSTYATIIQTIQDRGYVWKKGTALVPTWTAFAVINLLVQHFHDLVDFDFTARMEDDLDGIASGKIAPTPWLHDFYFGAAPNGS